MSYDVEHILKALKIRLQAELATQLDVVEAAWLAEDPVALPDVVTWYEGHKPTVLELESSSFPFLAVLVARREPMERPSRWGYQDQMLTAYVDFFVVADDETTVNKIAQRYVEAITGILQGERIIHGYAQADYEPLVQISEASRHAKTTNADMFDNDAVDYIQAARITVMMGGD